MFPALNRKAIINRGMGLAAGMLMRQAGYRQELRRNGDLKLALWRKSMRRKGAMPAKPRRFVLLPGWGDSPVSWLGVLGLLRPVFSRRYDEVVLFDFPGFQGSLFHERGFHDMDLLMTAVHDALDTLKPTTLMGHSLGGWLSGLYAGHCGTGARPLQKNFDYKGPELLILANPSGVFSSVTAREEWRHQINQLIENGFDQYRKVLFVREPIWFKLFGSKIREFFAREEVGQFIRSVRDDQLVEPLLSSIHCKVRLLWGEQDALIPAEWSEAWCKGLENCECVLLRRTGHTPQMERPAVTAAVLAHFLLGKEPHRSGKYFWRIVKTSVLASAEPN